MSDYFFSFEFAVSRYYGTHQLRHALLEAIANEENQ